MKLINPTSKKAFVNLFSDFVLENLGKNTKTVIQTTLYENFIMINGITDSNVVIEIGKIKEDFFKKYEELIKNIELSEKISTFNTIKKSPEYFKNNCQRLYLDLYNTDRPIYHRNVLNYHQENKWDSVDWNNEIILEVPHNTILPNEKFVFSPIQITSEFPFGHSLELGRSLIYYGEYISFNIFNTISVDNFKMVITNQKNINGDPIISISSKSPYPKEKIESMILDNFNFDLESFNNLLSKYDLCEEITNVRNEKPWLIKNMQPQDLYFI